MTRKNQIIEFIEAWAKATEEKQFDQVIAYYSERALIFDVLPPLQYKSAASYEKSWDEWQPETKPGFRFYFTELAAHASEKIAFAHGILHCKGETSEGKKIDDTVRCTFCLEKHDDVWRIVHQHSSMPQKVDKS